MVSGAIAGFAFLLVIFAILYQFSPDGFSVQSFLLMHRHHPVVFLVDILPLLCTLLAYLLSRLYVSIEQKFYNEREQNIRTRESIRSAIQELTQGGSFSRPEESVIDPEIRDSMVQLENRLKENRTREKIRRKEDDQRNWVSEGLARFGDLLRKHPDNLEELSYAVISELVRHLDINQGGFFIVDDSKRFAEFSMIACHAYDRKKFPDRRIAWGEGLIGAVALEQKSYYTNKIPDGYLTITSGLGKSNPRFLLLVPMVLNEEVFGVLELASFHPLESFKIQFVERVAENTATSLNILKSNLRTAQLLKETQAQAEQLARQEEQVRKNIEELKETQAEAARQSEQFISFSTSVNHTLIRAEYDTRGVLIYANTKFLKKLGYAGNREVEGKHISMFIDDKDAEWFNTIWDGLAKGGAHFEGYMKHVTKQGRDLWTMATYSCVRRDDGSVEKILFLAIDSTEQKEESLNYEGQVAAINSLSPKAEFSPDGRLLFSNQLFNKTLNYTEKEITSKNVFDFIMTADQERFNEIWEQVLTRNAYQGQLRMINKYEEEIWFRASFTVVDDMYGEIEKIIFLAYEITKEREMELTLREQHRELSRKEEEMRLQALDLRKEIERLTVLWNDEKVSMKKQIALYDSLVRQLPYPVVTINNLGFVVQFNKAAESYWGKKAAAVESGKVATLFEEKQDAAILSRFIDAAVRDKEADHQKALLRIKGKPAREEQVSIISMEMGDEIYYSLLIHMK
jgi:PAS domain S-box-containing protein